VVARIRVRAMSDIDPGASFAFEPAPIGPRRRRRGPQPVVVGTLVVALALAVAVIKPWDGDTGAALLRRSLTPLASGVAAATVPPTPVPLDPSDPGDAVAVLAALERHDLWGVQVVAQEAGTTSETTLVEHWFKVVPTPDGGVSPLIVTSVPSIVALGISAPAEVTPLDVRVWARGHDGQWHWLEVGGFASDRPAAELLLPPPTVDGATLPIWPPGRYRLDLLMGQAVYRLDLTIDPDVAPDEAPVSRWSIATGDGTLAWLDDIRVGPFAVSNGFVLRLTGRDGATLRDAEAWLGLDGQVASMWLPSATGLGVVLPEGSRDASANIRRIAPDPGDPGTMAQVEVEAGTTQGGAAFIGFDAVAGSRFEPGLYAIDVAWNERSGSRSSTWHVELRPGPAARPSTLLEAARLYGDAAGVDGLILRGAGRRQTDDRDAPVRSFPMAASIGCGDALIDETPAVLGLGHATDIHPRSITATLRGPNGREIDVPLRIAPVVIPGLTLIAPARGVAFAAGIYRFTIFSATGWDTFTVCLGTSPFNG